MKKIYSLLLASALVLPLVLIFGYKAARKLTQDIFFGKKKVL